MSIILFGLIALNQGLEAKICTVCLSWALYVRFWKPSRTEIQSLHMSGTVLCCMVLGNKSLVSDLHLPADEEEHAVARQLLLDYLADKRHGDALLYSSAREFMLCQALANEVTGLQRVDASEEDQMAALVRHREHCEVLSRGCISSLADGESPSANCRVIACCMGKECKSIKVAAHHALLNHSIGHLRRS